jgi:hypothetical protein
VENIIYQYNIAGIKFKIDSSFPIKGLSYKRFSVFHEESDSAQINFIYHEIDLNFSKSNLALSAIKTKIKKYTKFSGHIFANPLFYHELVLRELADNINHMDSIFIDSNQSSLSIFNFFSNQLNVFFKKNMSQIIKDSRMGPYSLAPFFISFSSAMIHSSALIRGEKAAVFLSPDEGGKTTSISLSSEGTVLSDDQNIIREKDGKIFVHGTPWGNYFNKGNAPIGAFFILRKANKFSIKPEDKNTLLSYLWNEHLAYHFFLPKKISKSHFDFLYRISRQVPVYLLEFPKDYIDWDEIDRIITSKHEYQ